MKLSTQHFGISFKNNIELKWKSYFHTSVRLLAKHPLNTSLEMTHDRWSDIDHRKEFLHRLGRRLELKDLTGWYDVRRKEFLAVGKHPALTLLNYFDNSLSKAITSTFPEHPWVAGRFRRLDDDQLMQRETQMEVLQECEKNLGIKKFEEWYKFSSDPAVTRQQFGGVPAMNKLLTFYNGSLVDLLLTLRPDCDWLPWKFTRLPRHFWKEKRNQRNFMERLGMSFGIADHNWERWYLITKKEVVDFGGRGLFREYSGMKDLLMSIFTEYQWDAKQFRTVVREPDTVKHGHYKNPDNRKRYFDDLAKTLNIRHWQEWYKVSRNTVIDQRGSSVLNYYPNMSLISALTAVYPEYPWEVYRFKELPRYYWDSESNCKKFLDQLAQKLKIESPEDWFAVSNLEIFHHGGYLFIVKYGGLFSALHALYPETKWNAPPDRIHGSKAQRVLYRYLLEIFADEPEVLYSHRHPELRYAESDSPMELDVYIPSLNLAFEYQGQYHYEQADIRKRDQEKKETCKQNGITVIEVPYWWDRSKKKIVEMIAAHDPALVAHVNLKEDPSIRPESSSRSTHPKSINLASSSSIEME